MTHRIKDRIRKVVDSMPQGERFTSKEMHDYFKARSNDFPKQMRIALILQGMKEVRKIGRENISRDMGRGPTSTTIFEKV